MFKAHSEQRLRLRHHFGGCTMSRSMIHFVQFLVLNNEVLKASMDYFASFVNEAISPLRCSPRLRNVHLVIRPMTLTTPLRMDHFRRAEEFAAFRKMECYWLGANDACGYISSNADALSTLHASATLKGFTDVRSTTIIVADCEHRPDIELMITAVRKLMRYRANSGTVCGCHFGNNTLLDLLLIPGELECDLQSNTFDIMQYVDA